MLTAVLYGNIGETVLASEYAKRGYELRDRVSEHEKLSLNMLESSSGARTEYQSFLTLWKDADIDTPVFKQATAEFRKLQ